MPSLSLHLVNRLDELPRVFAEVELFACRCPLSAPLTQVLQLCVEEWLANVITHGTEGLPDSPIQLDLECGSGRLLLRTRDLGPPFDPLEHLPDPVPLADPDRMLGGMGIILIKKLMDTVEYRRIDGQNELTMTKEIRP
jgi:anti-sigma regulatory factor (Ser/Thr protein kinase)